MIDINGFFTWFGFISALCVLYYVVMPIISPRYLEKQEVIPAKGHTSATDNAVEPTCTETGLTEGTVILNEKAATCTEEGYTGDVCCAECHAILNKGEVIPATGHNMTDWVETGRDAATCCETGTVYYERTCTVCGHVETKTEELEALGHDYVLTSEKMSGKAHCHHTWPSTGACNASEEEPDHSETVDGIRTYTCSRCGDKYTEDCTLYTHYVVKTYTSTGYYYYTGHWMIDGEGIASAKHKVTVKLWKCREDGSTYKQVVSYTDLDD